MNKTFGILAHVDAGKTTFSEQVLFRAHALRRAGRVDHRDAFMDSHPLERQRGITIFSDQATFAFQGDTWNWVDTPGHTDFAGEIERAIQVMDYAVLVVSCVEGVQSHTETVWRLLEKYGVPVFVFLNKTDRVGADPDGVLCRLRERFGTGFFDLRRGYQAGILTDEGLIEQAAEGDEALLDRAVASYKAHFRDEHIAAGRLYPGWETLLPALKAQGVKLGVATLKFVGFARKTTDHFGLTPLFDAICGSVPEKTPSKEGIIREALAEMGIDEADADKVRARDAAVEARLLADE